MLLEFVWKRDIEGRCKAFDPKSGETGIEPATSSLGSWVTIENKTHRVHGGLSESMETHESSQCFRNFVLTQQNCGRNFFGRDISRARS